MLDEKKRKNAPKEDKSLVSRKIFLEKFRMFEGRINDQLKKSVSNPLDFFKCNQEWPMCAFNFTKHHVIPEDFAFKIENINDVEIFDDYFSPENMLKN